jgi:hypothetical protein
MNKRTACLAAFAAGHLALVACGAAGLGLLPEDSAPEKALRWYGAVSGADNRYGFFAPDVGAEARAVLTLTDAAGRSWTEPVTESANQEVRLRLGSLFSQAADGSLRGGLAASWAARAFGRHPEAVAVTVRVDVYDVRTMDEYRHGQAAEWQTVYQRSFRRGASVVSQEGGV